MKEAQLRAKKKWTEKNREKVRYYSAKSTSRKFITDLATTEDLELLRDLIIEKLQEQQKQQREQDLDQEQGPGGPGERKVE